MESAHTFMSFCALATLASVRTCCMTAFLTVVESIAAGVRRRLGEEKGGLEVRSETVGRA